MKNVIQSEISEQIGAEFLAFFGSAATFCAFIERESLVPQPNYLQTCRMHLLDLYSKALMLPSVPEQSISSIAPQNTNAFDSPTAEIARQLGEARYYWLIGDPTSHVDATHVCGDLLDDLEDIYQAVKTSVLSFEAASTSNLGDAMWQAKFDFENHWDKHCICALYGIHSFLNA